MEEDVGQAGGRSFDRCSELRMGTAVLIECRFMAGLRKDRSVNILTRCIQYWDVGIDMILLNNFSRHAEVQNSTESYSMIAIL